MGLQVNKFEQVCDPGHQMSSPRRWEGSSSKQLLTGLQSWPPDITGKGGGCLCYIGGRAGLLRIIWYFATAELVSEEMHPTRYTPTPLPITDS